MKTYNVLTDLTNLSPIINDRIDELIRSPIRDDEGTGVLTIDQLMNEAVELLINLLTDNGINVYGASDIINDRYNVKHLIRLYSQFLPNNIRETLRQSSVVIDIVRANVDGIAPNEFIMRLVECMVSVDTSYIDMYVYLHDKISSTAKYVDSIQPILEGFEFSQENDDVIPEEVSDFLVKLTEEKRWFADRLQQLVSQNIIELTSGLINKLKQRYLSEYSVARNAILLSQFAGLVSSNNATIKAVLNNIRRESEFHVDSYTQDELMLLPKETVIMIILAQYSDQRLLGTEPDFTRLSSNTPESIDIHEMTRQMPVQNVI